MIAYLISILYVICMHALFFIGSFCGHEFINQFRHKEPYRELVKNFQCFLVYFGDPNLYAENQFLLVNWWTNYSRILIQTETYVYYGFYCQKRFFWIMKSEQKQANIKMTRFMNIPNRTVWFCKVGPRYKIKLPA